MPSSNNTSLRTAAEQWLRIDPDPQSRAEVQALLARVADDGDDAAPTATAALAELRDRFSGPLEFGTAGLRAKMGAGPARMNRVTVQQATQGLANYLLDETPGTGGAAVLFGASSPSPADSLRRAGVVIGHDARRGSAHFARVAAAVLASKGIRVYLFGSIVPTPFVAAGVAFLKAAGGVMVTASHNTKEYNGYKVYWMGGSQIVPPIDGGIAKAIRKSEAEEGLWELPQELLLADDAAPQEATAASVEAGAATPDQKNQPLITDPTDAVVPLYYRQLVEGLRFRPPEANARAQPVVYTPLHGVGLTAVERAFQAFNLPPPLVVAAQAQPDPDFPTVVFPNPEEGAGTWDLAFEAGRKNNARLVLANDPDADRLAAAERDASFPGGYRPFSGNEIGLLLADWVWRNRGNANKKQAMLASAVSSRALGSVAEREGFLFEQTLTGFKWLGTVARRMMAGGGKEGGDGDGGGGEPKSSPSSSPPSVDEVLFAFEEAIGFMFPGTGVLDKDGVAGACAFAEMAADRYAGGGGGDAAGADGEGDAATPSPKRTLAGRLEELYALYGRFCSRSGYFIADPPSKGAAVFEEWRQEKEAGGGGCNGNDNHGGRSYPSSIGGLRVASVRDLGIGLDTAQPDTKPLLPWSEGDMMVTFELEDLERGLRGALTLRGSGTEPKLKYYAEVWTVGGGAGGAGEDAGGGAESAAKAAEAAVVAVAKAVADDLVRPEERGLKRQGGG
jgi:phosphomannomutase